MKFFVLFIYAQAVYCAPIDENSDNSFIAEKEVQTTIDKSVQTRQQNAKLEDPSSTSDKNPVQEWFENLSKNASTNAQNAMDTFKNWISKLSENANNLNSAPQNVPTMYMGSFQLLKMPMPQFGDVIKGMGDLATAAQTFNKVTGGLPLTQGLPLISQTG